MRAIQVNSVGGPEALELVEIDPPTPGPGELLVEVRAAGVNFIDTYQRAGVYPLPLPLIPGSEGAGVVRATGDGVTEFQPGDRVAWGSGALGAYAEQTIVPAASAVPVPDGLSDEQAAAAMLQGMTAHYLVNSTYPVQSGDTVLVHAAAGGMGLLLTQLIKAKGGRVIGTVSTAEKEKLAREAGADEIIRYTEEDIAPRVRELTGGVGVPVVYDGVGKSTFEASLSSLRPRGYMVLFGGASGQVPPLDPQRLNALGSLFLTRPKLGDYTRSREEMLWRAGDILNAVADGTLSLRIGGSYPLAEASRAHTDLEGRLTAGKLLLLP
ncbi:quinone oxidoreductase [Pseudonocardiaceae bacterium YIM PH 21723]|nr:quinone oxidoreductase [Pseudonocardiaceae bacterium YIM PH 21723]